MPIPNIANGLIPIVSNNLPATGPNAPMTNAPGNSNNPESNAENPLRFCKYNGSKIIPPYKLIITIILITVVSV